MKSLRGSSILQYTVLLSILAIALFAMSTYIKRGMQANIKDLADGFIGSGKSVQEADTGVLSESSSNATTNYSANMITQDRLGGGSSTTLNDMTTSNTSGKTIDFKSSLDKGSSGNPDTVPFAETKTFQSGGN